jgi:hypothetical protein
MDHGDGLPVACPLAARRQDGRAEGEGIGSVALASDRAGRAWNCGGVRRELGRPAGCVAERLAASGPANLSGAGLAGAQLSPRRGDTTVWRRIRDNRNARNAGIFRDRNARINASICGDVGGLSTHVGSYYGANEQCVSLTRDFDSSLPPSSQWQQGELVEGATDIAPGTPIATFNFDGAYGPPDSPGGESGVSHTGIYLGQDASGVQILDQWSGSGGASIHTIPWSSWGGNTAEAGSHYYTIK